MPADYNNSGKNYPVIIWLHGAGQLGQGNTTDLPKVLQLGLPNVISSGGFPATFTVADTDYSFIVISPQFIGWPSGSNLAGVISYVTSNFRVDPERIYLLGMSAGGGAVWDYASTSVANSNKVAAIIPFAGTMNPTQAQANLPVWSFHNTNDGTVPVANSRNWKSMINAYTPTPSPLMRLTEFPVSSGNAVIAHDCWTNTTVTSYKVNNQNIYEWLLGYKKRLITVNIPPTAYAGEDASIYLPADLVLNGSQSSDPDGNISFYQWRKISGPASYQFSDSTIANPTVKNLSVGLYSFELTVKDNQNAVSKDTMLANVSPEIVQGAQRQVLIDVGPAPTVGTLTVSPTNGLYWNNMTDARPGERVASAKTTANVTTTIGLSVINRIDGTSNTGSNGMNGANTTPAVGIYPTSATRDFAYAHSSATNGKWRITGLEADKLYVIKFWGSKSGETSSRDIEIKRSDESVWKTYGAASNTNFNTAASFNVIGKTDADFDIKTKAGSIYGYINVVDISWTVAGSNLPPLANAGADITLQVPPDSAALSGCASTDPEAGTLKFKWRKLAGPNGSYFSNDTLCNSKVKNLVAGSYTFELTVTDNAGQVDRDTVSITATAAFSFDWPVLPAPICPQPYNLVILGSSTAVGTGASPLDSSWANKFETYLQQQNAQVTVTNLALGGYTSYQVNPTGFATPPDRPAPDTSRNITAALALHPDAIVINLPSNDAAAGFTLTEIQNNFNRIVTAADALNIPVWITTSQPRSGLSAPATNNLILLKDWVNLRFGNKAIDFWTDIANADGSVNNFYSAGDGVHLNNYGHHLVFKRILEEKIWDSICLRRVSAINKLPIANAGTDLLLQRPADSVRLNGSASYDMDGTITKYKWRKVQGGNATLMDDTVANPWVRDLSAGNYLFELTVTDDSLALDKDSVVIVVNEQPIARAGSDGQITLPVNSFSLNGLSSSDSDGNIVSFSWRKVSAGNGVTIASPTSAQTNLSFTNAGTYQFELTVTDNKGGIHKDSVAIIVNPDPNVPPVAQAGQDKSIQLPTNSVLLDGRSSTDANGSIVSYQWTYVSGPAGSQLLTATKDTSSLKFINSSTYVFRLTVTDNGGLTGNDDVQIIVQPALVTTKSIRVNISDGSIIYNNSQWNNWAALGNINSALLKYEDGSPSTVIANLLQGGKVSDNGANYLPAATGCPPEVLRINSMHTIQRTLTISGLSASKSYNFEFYGSRGFTSSSKSIYKTGSKADTINTDFNGSDVARLNNIVPDNNGKIVFTLILSGLYHYMAGFSIIEPATVPAVAAGFMQADNSTNLATAANAEEASSETKIYPNPFDDKIQVQLGNSVPGNYKIYLTDVAGKIILQKNISVASAGAGIVESFDTRRLQKGIYFLKIITKQKRTVHKLVKQ